MICALPRSMAFTPRSANFSGVVIYPNASPVFVARSLMLYSVVATAPGLTAVTKTPSWYSSMWVDREKFFKNAFVALYVPSRCMAISEVMELIFRM